MFTSVHLPLVLWHSGIVLWFVCEALPPSPATPSRLPSCHHTHLLTHPPWPHSDSWSVTFKGTRYFDTILKLSELRQRNEAGEEHFWIVLASLWDRVKKNNWKSLQDCLQTAVTRTPACGGIYALVCFLGHSCLWKIDFQQIVLGILTICDCWCHACFSVFVECDRLWMFCWSTSQWILSGWQYVKSQLLTSQCFVCL